jgi:ELWxxDGT repeat protein
MLPPILRDTQEVEIHPLETNNGIVDTIISSTKKAARFKLQIFSAVVALVMVIILFSPLSELWKDLDDSPTQGDTDGDVVPDIDSSNPELGEWNSYSVATSADLPLCDDETNGRLYYVEGDENFQVCNAHADGWQVIDITGLDGADGQSGANGTDGTDGDSPMFNVSASTNCTEGGYEIKIGFDIDGNGALNETEVEVTLDICNGEAGMNGSDGSNGQDGADGDSIAFLTTPEPIGANCTYSGIRIDAGLDDDADGVLQTDEIDQTHFLCNGEDGTNGSASPDTMLTRISSPPLSMGCTAMGRVVENGLDNGDGGGVVQNGVLEDGEVDYVATYCDRFVYERLTDINPSGDSMDVVSTEQVFIGNTMFFGANDGTNGRELWAYDFDNSSSWMVADINPGSLDSNPDDFTVMGTRLYFTASDSASGNELWAYETTNATTWLVFDINPDGHSNPESLTVLNSSIYFIAYISTPGDYYLWEHDTTNGSTWKLSDVSFIRPTYTMSVNKYFSRIAVYDDYLYVTDYNGILHGYSPTNSSLWEVAPSGSPMTFDQAFSLETVGNQIIIRTALTVDLTGKHSELWIYSPMNYSSWKLPITIKKNHNADILDPSIIVNSQIYFWGGQDCDCLYIYDSTNSTLWPVNMTFNGTQLSNQRQIGFIGSMMFHNANGAQGPMYVHDFANSSTWEVGNFSGLWFMMEYDSSIIFTGVGDGNGAEYWRLWIEQSASFN